MTIPTIDLRNFIIHLAQGALVGLGETEDPETKQTSVHLPIAIYHIGVLEMLQKKTENNRSTEETELLKALLTELHEKLAKISAPAN